MRSITVDEIKYRYNIGRTMTIIRREDNSVLLKVENHVMKGFKDPDTFDRGQWKKTSDGQITPKEIAYVISYFLKHNVVAPVSYPPTAADHYYFGIDPYYL